MFVDAIEWDDKIFSWYRLEDDLIYMVDDAPYYCYQLDDDGEYLSLFGDKLSLIEFNTRKEYNNFTRKKHNLFESDISPVHKFSSDNCLVSDDRCIHYCFYDIEVDYNLEKYGDYPSHDNPYGVVNSISLYDAKRNTYHLLMLTTATYHEIEIREDENVKLYYCVTERQLFDTFIKVIHDIDVLMAWNGRRFDLPYLMARFKVVYGERKGSKKMCRDNFYAVERETHDDYGNEFIEYQLVGRVHLDYMEVYKKFSFKEKPSYALDDIAYDELKERKISYDGDLSKLYRTDPDKFFSYSLHDTRLLKLLDDRLKLFDLVSTLVKEGSIRFTEVFGSIRYLEQSMRNYCHFKRSKPIILPDREDVLERQSFPGGFVLETKVGVYSWVSSIDLASLYPSVIRALNISPETHLLQCENKTDDFIKVVEKTDDDIVMIDMSSGETVVMKAYDVNEMLVKYNMTISAYGSIFDNEKIGLLPEILGIWYEERKELKRKAKECYERGDMIGYSQFDLMQLVKKVSLNSFYGAVSNMYCRFFSIYLAGSVTTSGQMIEKFQIWKSNEYIKNEIN